MSQIADEEQASVKAVAYYLGFFVLQSMANALLVAFYAAQAFGYHESCFSASGHNITRHYEAMFIGGFALHSVVFLDQTFVDPYFRGALTKKIGDTRIMYFICTFIEWLLHLFVLMFTAVVLLLTEFGKYDSKNGVQECMGNFELGPERQWLTNLAISQPVKITLFVVLRYLWVKTPTNFDTESSSSRSDKNQMSPRNSY